MFPSGCQAACNAPQRETRKPALLQQKNNPDVCRRQQLASAIHQLRLSLPRTSITCEVVTSMRTHSVESPSTLACRMSEGIEGHEALPYQIRFLSGERVCKEQD
eukprot:762733-Hanusia_phi.AAC.5